MLLIVLTGLPGAGKSALAQALAPRIDGVILNKDPIRAALFPAELVEYSSGQDDFVIGLMLETALYLLRRYPRRPILLDGRTYRQKYQLAAVREFAAAHAIECRVIECVCSEAAALARIARDVAAGDHPARNRDAALYRSQARDWEGIDPPKTVIDTDQPLEECVTSAVRAVTADRS